MVSIAEQSIARMGGALSVLTRQKLDHVKLDGLLRQLDKAAPSEQDAVLLKIYQLVFPHAFAEEAVLWPVIRRVLTDGHELTLRVEREHQQINELVTQLESLKPGSQEREAVLARIVELLRQDVRDEEDELLPRLQLKVTDTQLRLLGLAWEAVRRTAPTRAHPIVARRPPGNVLAALPLSIIDHCRDLIDALLHRGAGAADPSLQTLSRALARAAHAVERLPGMRSGEDASTRVGRQAGYGWGAAAVIAFAAGSAAVLLTRRDALAR
jgi:hemerythrin superfamily protein